MDRKGILDNRKKIKLKLQERPTELKFHNPIVKQCILSSVENGDDWRPAVAAEAFSVLEKLALNLMFNPERRLYHELKTYSGTFKHLLSRLALIEDVLRELGYRREGTSYFLHRHHADLASLCTDFLHASLLCEIMHDLYGLESIDNRRLMCRIRLDPAYLESQDAAERRPAENGHRPAPSGRVKFVEGDSCAAVKPRSPKDLSSLASTDNRLTRPKPRSILRQPAAPHSVPIPVERYESPPAARVEPNIRVASIPPPPPGHDLPEVVMRRAAPPHHATAPRRRSNHEPAGTRRPPPARPASLAEHRHNGLGGGYRR